MLFAESQIQHEDRGTEGQKDRGTEEQIDRGAEELWYRGSEKQEGQRNSGTIGTEGQKNREA